MTKEEAKILQEQLNTTEHYILTIVASHFRALRKLIVHLTQEE